jgi:hypothetical protein
VCVFIGLTDHGRRDFYTDDGSNSQMVINSSVGTDPFHENFVMFYRIFMNGDEDRQPIVHVGPAAVAGVKVQV